MENPFDAILAKLEEIERKIIVSKANGIDPVEIINREELMKRLEITEPTAITWGKRGKIPEMRIGSNVRYNWYSVVRTLEEDHRKRMNR